MAGRLLPCERRGQEVVRDKQKKLNLNRSLTIEPPGFNLQSSVQIWFFRFPPFELRLCELTGVRSLGVRISDPPLSPTLIFFMQLSTNGIFCFEMHIGFFFGFVCTSD